MNAGVGWRMRVREEAGREGGEEREVGPCTFVAMCKVSQDFRPVKDQCKERN